MNEDEERVLRFGCNYRVESPQSHDRLSAVQLTAIRPCRFSTGSSIIRVTDINLTCEIIPQPTSKVYRVREIIQQYIPSGTWALGVRGSVMELDHISLKPNVDLSVDMPWKLEGTDVVLNFELKQNHHQQSF